MVRTGEIPYQTIPNHTILYQVGEVGFIEQLREGSVHTDWACTECMSYTMNHGLLANWLSGSGCMHTLESRDTEIQSRDTARTGEEKGFKEHLRQAYVQMHTGIAGSACIYSKTRF